MANTDNTCAHLNIEDKYKDSKEHLKDIFEIQSSTQRMYFEKQGAKQFKDMNLKELMSFWHMNNHAIIDECHEATDALGGINDGIGNAVWKRWKADNKKAEDMKISDLTPDDLAELKFEIVDILHFFINMAISIDMTAEEMYNMYLSKNEENWRRAKNNY
jgi:hypothetical protein